VKQVMEKGGKLLLGLLLVRGRYASGKLRPTFGQLLIRKPDFLVGCFEAASLGRLGLGQTI